MPLDHLPRVLSVAVALAAISLHAQTADRVVPTDEVKIRVVVRENAAGSSANRGSIRPGGSAELLGSVPNWHRIRLTNGVEGFVAKRWTRIVSAGAPAPAGGPTFTIDVVDAGPRGGRADCRAPWQSDVVAYGLPDGVMASTFVVSSGPTKYETVVLPDGDVIAELGTRGQLLTSATQSRG